MLPSLVRLREARSEAASDQTATERRDCNASKDRTAEPLSEERYEAKKKQILGI